MTENVFNFIEKEYIEHYAYLKNFLSKLTNDEKLAEDLIQETFIKLLKHPDSIKEVTYFRSWLITCAKNLLIDHYRRKTPQLLKDDSVIIKLLCTSKNPESELVLKDTISQALKKFSDIDRSIFISKEYYGYKYDEISQLLNISVNNIKSRMFRMKKAIISTSKKGGNT